MEPVNAGCRDLHGVPRRRARHAGGARSRHDAGGEPGRRPGTGGRGRNRARRRCGRARPAAAARRRRRFARALVAARLRPPALRRAAFLVWLGLGLLLRRVEPAAAPRTTARAAFAEGMVSNLTNPNVLVFMLAFLPQFVDPAKGSVMGQMLLFGAV